ncbi:Hypothetical_protein [Hexamita inflata]|nr:Hypothetical protein HINF_LOCUS36034 [Hexamita inflata]
MQQYGSQKDLNVTQWVRLYTIKLICFYRHAIPQIQHIIPKICVMIPCGNPNQYCKFKCKLNQMKMIIIVTYYSETGLQERFCVIVWIEVRCREYKMKNRLFYTDVTELSRIQRSFSDNRNPDIPVQQESNSK